MVSSSLELTDEQLRAAGFKSAGVAYFDYVLEQAVAQYEATGREVFIRERTYRKMIAPPWKEAGYFDKTIWEVWVK